MKNKGFTLAEVMGVIVLLGIIALITIPSVENYVNDSKQKSYDTTVKEIVNAAKNWNSKYGDTVTWINDESLYVLNLSDLKQTEFLTNEEIINPKTKEEMNGCVVIRVVSDDYTYVYKEDGCDINE